MEGCEFVLQTL
jgi:hypothetical protein